MAENARPHVKQVMKIDVAPWMRGYNVEMEELYTELSLEQIENKALGRESKRIRSYKMLFDDKGDHRGVKNIPAKKILGKGDPGMGKTTVSKKIAYDWACGTFTRFVIVFSLFVNLIRPGQPIEGAIIDQNDWLDGYGIGKAKIKYILEHYGKACLLIIDGLDEHTPEQNQEIFAMIRGRKYPHCNLFLTSRPHYLKDTDEVYFPIIIRVEGFTILEAKKFTSKLLNDSNKISDIFNFDEYICRCPILVSFLCLLVREEDIKELGKSISKGEIYFRMIRCLYKKFTIRHKKAYDENEFIDVIKKIGKLALETLISGNFLLQRKNVIKEIGPEAFDYGLLIGHEDPYRLLRDVTADIFVTFPHPSIKEFLGAFYFICELDDGQSVSNRIMYYVLGNTSVLHFCIWLLYSDQSYFHLNKRLEVREKIVEYIAVQEASWKKKTLDIYHLREAHKEFTFHFWTDVLLRCQTNTILCFGYSYMIGSWASSKIINSLLPYLKSKLKTFNLIYTVHCQATRVSEYDITLKIIESNDSYDTSARPYYDIMIANAIIQYCGHFAKDARLHIFESKLPRYENPYGCHLNYLAHYIVILT